MIDLAREAGIDCMITWQTSFMGYGLSTLLSYMKTIDQSADAFQDFLMRECHCGRTDTRLSFDGERE
jgi:hypothetical protein